MSEIPRVRCPCCGMLVYLRNLKRRHSVDSYVHVFGGKQADGKPVCYYQRIETPGLVSYWIRRLETVLLQLRAIELGTRQKIVIPDSIAKMTVSEVYGSNIGKLIVKGNKATRLVAKGGRLWQK